ncbi:hypothetical protein M3J09_011118 [Ascochyta lentis]
MRYFVRACNIQKSMKDGTRCRREEDSMKAVVK